MKLTTTLVLTTIFALGVQAQVKSLPSQEDIESDVLDHFATNKPLQDYLTAYYATHSFSVGSRLASWAAKVQSIDIGILDQTYELTPEQQELAKSLYAELPISEFNDVMYQYYPTSTVGPATDIEGYLSQWAALPTGPEGLPGLNSPDTSGANVAARMTFSVAMVLGLSGAVAALALI